jgi:O-antigen/teichoic acid export membrane protein
MPVFVFFGLVRQRWLLAEHALPAALAVEIAGCGLNVLANLVLIPRYGAAGAAMASLIGVVGATLLIAPFSDNVRRSLMMLLRAARAPFGALRRA